MNATTIPEHHEPAPLLGLGSSAVLGPNVPKLTREQVCNIGFSVLRAHNDDRLWRALTYDSGPYDLTTPNLALQELGAAFYAAGYAEAPKTTMKAEISADPELLRRAMAAETEAALLRAALDQKHAEYEDLQRHGDNTAHNLARMQAALAENASRSADYLRKAIKAEAEVALLRAALNGGNVIERLQFALQRLADAADGVGVKHFDTDWLSDEVQELQASTHAARLVLGPNVL